jgi:hypothetical protein
MYVPGFAGSDHAQKAAQGAVQQVAPGYRSVLESIQVWHLSGPWGLMMEQAILLCWETRLTQLLAFHPWRVLARSLSAQPPPQPAGLTPAI